MNYDISDILSNWDYDPTSINARWIMGADGSMKIQLRLDLGLFQMEAEGRPDGTRPRGYTSLLQYYTSILKTTPSARNVLLGSDQCAELQQESLQFYYRYLAFYSLRNYTGVIADTRHNLDIIELVIQHAQNEDLAWQFTQFYPYVRMMNARAAAESALENREHQHAIDALQGALQDIQKFWNEYGESDALGGTEVELLNDLLGQIVRQKPKSRADRLKEQLDLAIATEDYEKAAVLRDELQKPATHSQA